MGILLQPWEHVKLKWYEGGFKPKFDDDFPLKKIPNLDEIRPLLEAQHSTFDPITISWSQEKGGEDIGVWVESTNYPASLIYKIK